MMNNYISNEEHFAKYKDRLSGFTYGTFDATTKYNFYRYVLKLVANMILRRTETMLPCE